MWLCSKKLNFCSAAAICNSVSGAIKQNLFVYFQCQKPNAPAAMPLHSEHPRYITTIASGLLVVIPILTKDSRRVVTKTLTTALYASEDELMAAAVRWRDRAYRRCIGGEVPPRSFHVQARKGSATGVPGVRYIEKVVKKQGRQYVVPCVIAEVHTIPGTNYKRPSGSRSRLFSLNKFDYDEAIGLASAWRTAFIAELNAEQLSVDGPI
jgi:hypothetical protein